MNEPQFPPEHRFIMGSTRTGKTSTQLPFALVDPKGDHAMIYCVNLINVIAQALVALGRSPDNASIIEHSKNIESLYVDYAEHWLDNHGPGDSVEATREIQRTLNYEEVPMSIRDRSHHSIIITMYLKSIDFGTDVFGITSLDGVFYDYVLHHLHEVFLYDRENYRKITENFNSHLEAMTVETVSNVSLLGDEK